MSDAPIQLSINKTIRAPIDQVYQAWVQPDLLARWFGPGMIEVKEAQVDLTVGGEYMIHMYNPNEDTDHIVSGTYEQIIPNEKIVFNWKWQDGVDRTQVTILFHAPTENETLVTLTHIGFSEQEFADRHTMGWNGCIEKLKNLLQELSLV